MGLDPAPSVPVLVINISYHQSSSGNVLLEHESRTQSIDLLILKDLPHMEV